MKIHSLGAMFRRGFPSQSRRLLSTSDEVFAAAWRRVAPDADLPNTPLAFRHPPPSSTPSNLTLNFISRFSFFFSNKQVDMVIAPSVTGQMGILPGHAASISELKTGLLSIHEGDQVMRYFISTGFALVHSNSVIEIIAVEAVPVDQIDPASVQEGLTEFTQKLSTASTDAEKAKAQIGLDVLTALNSSLPG